MAEVGKVGKKGTVVITTHGLDPKNSLFGEDILITGQPHTVPITLTIAGSDPNNPTFDGQSAVTLGTDLTVAGSYQPAALPAAARESTVDGYTVTYEGTAQPGSTQPLLFRVFRGGRTTTLDVTPVELVTG